MAARWRSLERREPARAHEQPLPARGLELDLALQHAALHVEHALEARPRAVARSNGSSSTNEPDDRAVGGVDDRLARAGQAVGVLGVDDRPRLVEAVEDRAGVVRRACPPRACRGRRGSRCRPRTPTRARRRRRRSRSPGGRSTSCQTAGHGRQLPEVVDDDVGAGRAQLVRARRVRATPITSPNVAGAAGGDAGERVLDHDGARGASTPEPPGGLEEAVGSGLAAQAEPRDVVPSTVSSNRSLMPAARRTASRVGARGDHGGEHAGRRADARTQRDRAGEGLDAAAEQRPLDERLLAVADHVHDHSSRGCRLPSGGRCRGSAGSRARRRRAACRRRARGSRARRRTAGRPCERGEHGVERLASSTRRAARRSRSARRRGRTGRRRR